jgi:iron complex outermembrane receptor protein
LFNEKYVGTEFTVPYHFINPRVGINYNVTESLNLYGQISRTTREPRLKNLYDAAEATGGEEPQFEQVGGGYDFSRPLVKPEKLTDIEIGAGYVSFDYRATANVFYMDFTNEIVRSGRLDRFGQPITGNAQKTRHIGIELTGTARYGALELRGNMTMSRNRLIRYTVFDTGSPQRLDGNAIAGFPDVLANASISYSSSNFSTTITMQHVGRFFTDNYQDPDDNIVASQRTVDPYTVFNGWLSYRLPIESSGQSIEARFQVNNLFNKLYFAHGEGSDFFPGALRNIFASLRINL